MGTLHLQVQMQSSFPFRLSPGTPPLQFLLLFCLTATGQARRLGPTHIPPCFTFFVHSATKRGHLETPCTPRGVTCLLIVMLSGCVGWRLLDLSSSISPSLSVTSLSSKAFGFAFLFRANSHSNNIPIFESETYSLRLPRRARVEMLSGPT